MNSSAGSDSDILNKIFHKGPDIISRRIAGELFLVPVRGKLADMQQIFALNPVAEFIWNELETRKSLSDIRSRIVEEFTVTEEEAQADLQDFIAELLSAGLIKE